MSLLFSRSAALQTRSRFHGPTISRRRLAISAPSDSSAATPKGESSQQTVKKVEKEMAKLSSSEFNESTTNVKGLGKIVRHGHNDACITLNVGGKEFLTLRSTVNSNAVLADHVARAEANKEITKNGAVFVDRDPEHFGYILSHLRNRLELSTAARHLDKSSLTMFTKSHIHLPKDSKVLRELYVESTFYQIPELQDKLCSQSWLTNLIGLLINKNKNPFDSATRVLSQVRATLIAFGSIGALGGTFAVTMEEEWDWLLKKVGIRDDNEKYAAAATDAATA